MEKAIANLIKNIFALIIGLVGLYLISYISDWRIVLGLFLFCWANNIAMSQSILSQVSKLTDRYPYGKL